VQPDGNSRIAVFNREGEFVRQSGHQGTKEEADAGVGGAFMQVVHSVALRNNELLYACDRQGDRIQVFHKMGNITNSEVVTNKDAELVGCERRTGADGSVKL
jgi:hypothetical protein